MEVPETKNARPHSLHDIAQPWQPLSQQNQREHWGGRTECYLLPRSLQQTPLCAERGLWQAPVDRFDKRPCYHLIPSFISLQIYHLKSHTSLITILLQVALPSNNVSHSHNPTVIYDKWEI